MSEQEKMEAYLSAVRHDLRSQLVVIREVTSLILDGIGNTNCENCFELLKPSLESTDELNRLVGDLLSTSRFNAILAVFLSAKEEEVKTVKEELSVKDEELKIMRKDLSVKGKELSAKEEDLKRVKKEISVREEDLKRVREELSVREEELKKVKKDSPGIDLELLKYELTGMISHSIRTPLTVVKESLSLILDEIPGKLNPKQKELLSSGKQNVDDLVQSMEEIFEKPWNEIIQSARKQFPGGAIARKDRLPPKKKILIVEDQPMIANMLKMRLEANNYEVITAGDGQEGLDKARKEKPNLIILDVMLPKMNGYKVCQLLKADPNYSAIPIIISSGRTPQEIRKIGQEVGADAYVNKPFEAEVLLIKIKELLEKKEK